MSVYSWIGRVFGGRALADHSGAQDASPVAPLVDGTPAVVIDSSMQISAVWACVSIIADTISTLPLMTYENKSNGMRDIARDTTLWAILHTSPNSRMTSSEFWGAMLMNLLLRGNAYARIERDSMGEVYAIWPMAADQVEMQIIKGAVVYVYRIDNDVVVLAEESVLHIKGMGNGSIGLSRLEYMRASINEAANSAAAANKLFSNSGKPMGVLMVDDVLTPAQRTAVQSNFADMATGSVSRLFVLEAQMKYQQLSLSPEDMQLLETRNFGVEEICRWFLIPPVMVGHANVTTWGSGIEQIFEGFYKIVIRPALVRIEQAIQKRVLTAEQRSKYTIEYNFEGLLRVNIKDRMDLYVKAVNNGIYSRNVALQLENMPPVEGGDMITVPSNLVELKNLPAIGNQNAKL